MRYFAHHLRKTGTGTMKCKSEKTASTDGRLYYEQDNMGSRQDTMLQAITYWKKERPGLSNEQPFTLFTFSSADAAEKAMLELPFIHKAADSGKLICDRMMTFGLYETKVKGALTGQYEVLVAGGDLTKDELFYAEAVFSSHQGKCKIRNMTSVCADSNTEGGNTSLVRYSETIRGNDGISTYEVYNAPDKASAIAFLREKTIVRRYYYIIVDTPEGSFGKDFVGLYQE